METNDERPTPEQLAASKKRIGDALDRAKDFIQKCEAEGISTADTAMALAIGVVAMHGGDTEKVIATTVATCSLFNRMFAAGIAAGVLKPEDMPHGRAN